MIGGRVALRLDPNVLATVAGSRRSVLVTGTNGKSTVTALVAAAMSAAGDVASNTTGANMADGVVTALAADASELAALEVDEVYLGAVARGTSPAAVVALNLYREYTRGVSLRKTLEHWRSVAASLPAECVAIVNVDDPLVMWAFEDVPRRVGVAGGLHWQGDALFCPACGAAMDLSAGWRCDGCGRTRPDPDWAVEPEGNGWVVTHDGARIPVQVAMPGRTGPIGAAFALAAADVVGVGADEAASRVSAVSNVDGRYAPTPVNGRTVRLLMLKNPAGWAEAIDTATSTNSSIVLAVDPFGPKDTATMWEAPFEQLVGRTVPVTGGRRADVLAILAAAGVDADEAVDLESAVSLHPEGEVVVACNYPAFRRISKQLRNGHA